MRSLVIFLLFAMSLVCESKDVYVRGYLKKDGTFVAPHYRTNANDTVNDNYGTQGNYNPYTESWGTKPQDPTQPGYTGRSSGNWQNKYYNRAGDNGGSEY